MLQGSYGCISRGAYEILSCVHRKLAHFDRPPVWTVMTVLRTYDCLIVCKSSKRQCGAPRGQGICFSIPRTYAGALLSLEGVKFNGWFVP